MRLACLMFVAALTAGCASNQPTNSSRSAGIVGPNAQERESLGLITDATLKRDYEAERFALKDGQDKPLIGLALSGGGTKAAMFAHGVLHGLHASGVLDKVDTISTVSGGGYAAMWYYTKLIAAEHKPGFNVDSIFDDCLPAYWTAYGGGEPKVKTAMSRAVSAAESYKHGSRAGIVGKCSDHHHLKDTEGDPFRWQAHLVRWPDVFSESPVVPSGDAQGKPREEISRGLFKAIVIEPFKQLVKRGSSIPDLYQSGIERTWGANPGQRSASSPEDWSYTNVENPDSGSEIRLDKGTVTWEALRQLHTGYKTASRKRNLPVWIVNANSGGKSDDATDNASRNFEMTAFGSGSDTLGYVNNIDAPPITDLGTSVRASAGFADLQGLKLTWIRKPLEFLTSIWMGGRWGVDVRALNKGGTYEKRRLSDGGGADNLGLISLLKRGIPHIIVVDAAADDEGNMSDLCDVREAVSKKEIDISIEFDALVDFAAVCDGRAAYNISDWKSAVVKGKATWNKTGFSSTLWLVKAAWYQPGVAKAYNSEQCGESGMADCLLTVFYGHNTEFRVDEKDELSGMVFPQLGTPGATLNSSSYLMWGFRELGRGIGRQLQLDGKGGLLSTSTRCYQPVGDVRKNKRPYLLNDYRAKNPCPQTAFFK